MQTHTKEMETFCSTLFHNILNPLTVLSLEIDHQTRKAPTLQNQVDTMIHNITHLEYFVSLLCEQVRPSSFVKQFSVNEEIETAIEILSYVAKRKNVQLLTLLLHEVMLTGNQLRFHQIILDLLNVIMKNVDEEIEKERVIELTLEKRKKYWSLNFVVSQIKVSREELEILKVRFEKEFLGKMEVEEYGERYEVVVRFPIQVKKTNKE